MDEYQKYRVETTAVCGYDTGDLSGKIVERYPPFIPISVLSGLLDRSIPALRVAISHPASRLDAAIAASKIRLGGRVYFNTQAIAEAIAVELAHSHAPPQPKGAVRGKDSLL